MASMTHATTAGSHQAALSAKIERRTAVVGVVGLGYVGLPLVRAFHEAGFPTRGFDVDPRKVRMLAAGRSYLKHLGDGFVKEMAASKRFEATDDFSRLGEADAILICVPTPLGSHREADLTYVQKAAEAAGRTLRSGHLIVLESSTYPGTTREVVLPPLERSGLRCGMDFFVAFSPEREDPGRKDFNTQTIPKLVGGMDAAGGDLAQQLYQCAIRQVVRVSSCEVAEAAKLLENIYRAVNIAMVNEMKIVLTAMGIDVWEVIDAAATKPFGFQPFYPGPGLGGHCIPIDPFYLTWKARELGLPTRFIELAGEAAGFIPDPAWKRRVWGENWSTGDTYNSAFGQGYVLTTPIQLLHAVNTIINNGIDVRPTLVREVLDADGRVVAGFEPQRHDIREDIRVYWQERYGEPYPETLDETLRIVQEGMRAAVTLEGGTALSSQEDYLPYVPVGGKTGTSEFCDNIAAALEQCIPGAWPAHAFYVGYAPYGSPEISVFAFVYNGGEGSAVALPIASQVMDTYFRLKTQRAIEAQQQELPAQP